MSEQRAALRRLRIEYQDGKIVLVGSEGAVAIITGNVGFPSSGSDARRIVACVNACEGISTETLEKMELTQELVRYQAAIDVQKDRCDALRVRAVEVTEQRDELEKERDSLGESLRLVAEQADKWRVETHVFMQQRDELLTLLEAIYNTHRPDNNGAYTGEAVLCESFTRRARNLIAKCKEG